MIPSDPPTPASPMPALSLSIIVIRTSVSSHIIFCFLGGAFLWGWNGGTSGHRFSYITLYTCKYLFFIKTIGISYICCSFCSFVPLSCRCRCDIKGLGGGTKRRKKGNNFFVFRLKSRAIIFYVFVPLLCSASLFHFPGIKKAPKWGKK